MMKAEIIQKKIHELRGYKVLLDFDLAELYGTQTKVLKQAVNRNINRFPSDFMFEITWEEYQCLRSQNVTLDIGRGKHAKYLPFAFTEQGVAMLSSVLKSQEAVDVNISIMRAFVFIRNYALSHTDLTEKLKELESKYNQKFADIYEALKFLMDDKLAREDWDERRIIGFAD